MRANIDSKKSGEMRKSVSRELNGMSFPTGYTWSFGSGFEEEDATQKEMLINLMLALVLVYLVMAGAVRVAPAPVRDHVRAAVRVRRASRGSAC